MSWRDRLLGSPERAGPHQLARILRRGSPSARIRAARALARRQQLRALRPLLDDPVPGVRRAAARGLGWSGSNEQVEGLWGRLRRERAETVRCALAGALLRCGEPEEQVYGAIRQAAARSIGTYYGPRTPAEVTGTGTAEACRATWFEIGRQEAGDPVPRNEVIAQGRRQLESDPHGATTRAMLPALAAQDDPTLLAALTSRWDAVGRYAEHAYLEALGWLGDPRALRQLVGALRAMNIDPGRAFKHRRIAAMAIGRVGDPTALGELDRALVREALEFEGRPGAGLGIQYPVRNLLLWAVGEIGNPAAASTLVGYLDNTAGSATGGFHLPAMASLAKLGPAAAPALIELLDGPEVLAANAAGVLAAIGDKAGIVRARRDPRPEVRAAAATEAPRR